ncbi:hypothetical protein N657DRAFT_676838 [Parathielavia appendiculata]|uniref:Xylanolytic transcriptional activator regulatory domain-containing protein n=1 Tax=Parathielavia appendiculata TaxID=2587402 RepID=A0AAN6UA02_9PEZI|nr:hypothetical protein N657DRAFT_676838 [Parathielavia appendiculata]
MPREQALALLQDYLDHAFPLLPIIHSTTTRTIVSEFYDQLSRGGHVRPQVAALILCISAVSAWLWQPDAGRHARFASVREATQLWEIWRKWSFEILTRTQASDGSTLEGAQTWALLSYATLNAEGGSAYFRFLHYTAITAARELSMHLVDSPKADRSEDRVTREVKRRLWWHLAVTDWMLGSVGGPYEGTYSIQPRHMNVRYPRNLNDNDVATWDDSMTAPLNVPTQMSFVLQRIRIGEIVRTTLDARPPGSPDVDMPDDYNTVVALDRLFEQAFMDMPPFFQIPSPFQPEKLDSFQLQGAILQLCLLSRRARLHRPFFLQQHISANPRHQPSRDICLQCSRKSVCISVGILEASLDAARRSDTGSEPRQIEKMRPRSGLSAHRLGHIINHMFVACTVLAFYAGASSGPDNSPARRQLGDSGAEEPDRTAVHAELTNACRVLAALGAESPVAARLLRNLVSLLRRYQVQGVDGDEMLERLEGKERKETTGKGAAGHGHSQTFGETEVLSDVDGGLAPVAGPGDAHVDFDGLWDEFMGSSDDYTQLFADLDYHCGMGVNVA